jgi:hypothetical protein
MDPALLSAFANPATQLPASDPNGFVNGPDLSTAGFNSAGSNPTPSNAGDVGVTRNPATNPTNPGGPADQPNATIGSATNAGDQPNTNIAQTLGFPKFADWAKATGLPQNVTLAEREKILDKYLSAQENFMGRQDPEKLLKIKQLQHAVANEATDDQLKKAQIAESQTKVIQGELAKQSAMDAANGQISELQSQRDNLQAIANHPALPQMVGAAGQYNPGITDPQRNLKTYFDQIDGQKLIDGINKIKNESAVPGSPLNFRITQQEALAVKDSVNRLKRSQNSDDYKAAIASYTSILDRAIAAKQSQVARMPGVNQDLLKQFSYTPATSSPPSLGNSTGSSNASAPIIKTIRGQGTFQSLGNGQWKQIQ